VLQDKEKLSETLNKSEVEKSEMLDKIRELTKKN